MKDESLLNDEYIQKDALEKLIENTAMNLVPKSQTMTDEEARLYHFGIMQGMSVALHSVKLPAYLETSCEHMKISISRAMMCAAKLNEKECETRGITPDQLLAEITERAKLFAAPKHSDFLSEILGILRKGRQAHD